MKWEISAVGFGLQALHGPHTWTLPEVSQAPCQVHQLLLFPQLKAFGVSAQIGSGVARGGHEVRFHEGFHQIHQGF